VRPGQTVVVSGTTVTAVAAGRVTPAGARIIDAGGKYLVPGLWDMHVHLSMAGREALPVLLANGVTAVRDMGGNGPTVMAWRTASSWAGSTGRGSRPPARSWKAPGG